MPKEGKLIIFSAPSGAGKTTIVQNLLTKIPELEFSISATTRKPRGDEKEGKDYYFISKEEFLHRIAKKHFVELVVYFACRIERTGIISVFDSAFHAR